MHLKQFLSNIDLKTFSSHVFVPPLSTPPHTHNQTKQKSLVMCPNNTESLVIEFQTDEWTESQHLGSSSKKMNQFEKIS